MLTIRSNHILNSELTGMVLVPRERALRRLRDPRHAIEVLSGDTDRIDVSDFVFNNIEGAVTREYHCARRCGAHLLINFIQVEGDVRCACGPLEGTLL
jgi:hypothetical protein